MSTHMELAGTAGATNDKRPVHVAIIGAGMSGLCMGLTLRQAGIDTFTIFEKAADVGGTWRDNRYPGLTCDVPSPVYCYSFAPNPEWSSRYSPGPEIHRYFQSITDRYDLRRHIRFGSDVVEARYTDGSWRLRTADGTTHDADVVVAATGILRDPRLPDITGLDTFAGPAFHSARWDDEAVIDGRRVGVIGTGSTGVQLVTALSTRAARVVQFQRSAQWVLPAPNWTYSRGAKALLRRSRRLNTALYRTYEMLYASLGEAFIAPCWQRRVMQGACRLSLRMVRDRELRARLTPTTEPLCRRIIFSAGYFRAVQGPTVEVVDAKIDHVEPGGVVTSDGRLHDLDVLILATGFHAQAYVRPMAVTGVDGLTLDEAWADGPRAHRTTCLPGFPNLFLLIGPNSPIGNMSLVPMAESQARFVTGWIRRLQTGEITSVVPTAAATDAFNRELRDHLGSTVWASGCDSWYIGPDGYPNLWPFSAERFHHMLANPDDREFDLGPAR